MWYKNLSEKLPYNQTELSISITLLFFLILMLATDSLSLFLGFNLFFTVLVVDFLRSTLGGLTLKSLVYINHAKVDQFICFFGFVMIAVIMFFSYQLVMLL
jgi:hypothetical protein